MKQLSLFKVPSVVILLTGAVLLAAALVGGNWSGPDSSTREALAQGTLPTPKCAALPSGLVHWWTFNETSGTRCADIIGSRDGVPKLGAIGGTGPAPVTGMVGGALGFDGSTTFVEVPDSPGTLSFGNPTDDFTIDAWIKIASADKSGVRTIVDKRVEIGGAVSGYAFFLFNGLLAFQLADGAAANSTCDSSPTPASSCTNYVSSTDVADGNFRSVAVTVQRTGAAQQVKLYVDGSLVFAGATRLGNANNNASLMIGRGYPIVIATPYFKGAIDEVEIFNRALTQSEVQAIFDAFSAGKCTPTPTPTPTNTPTATPTNTPTATPTNTPTPTPTNTPTPTITPTPTPTQRPTTSSVTTIGPAKAVQAAVIGPAIAIRVPSPPPPPPVPPAPPKVAPPPSTMLASVTVASTQTVNPFTTTVSPGLQLTGLAVAIQAAPAAPAPLPGAPPAAPSFVLSLPVNLGAAIAGAAQQVGLSFTDRSTGITVTPTQVTIPIQVGGQVVAIITGVPQMVQGTGTTAQITVTNLSIQIPPRTTDYRSLDTRVGGVVVAVRQAPMRGAPTSRTNIRTGMITPLDARGRLAFFYRRSAQALPGSFGPVLMEPVAFLQQQAALPFVTDVAYALTIDTVDLDVNDAEIEMRVGMDWVDSVKLENIAIVRETSDGEFSILSTKYVGKDEEGRATFVGMSPDGFSIFYLTAFEQPPPQPTPTPTPTPAVTATATPVATPKPPVVGDSAPSQGLLAAMGALGLLLLLSGGYLLREQRRGRL